MRTILTVLAAAVLGCGDPLPTDEADSCPADWEVQSCDVVCASGELETNALYSTCPTEHTGPAGCWFGCIDSGMGDGLKVCGCCVTVDEGDQRAVRWELCQ